MISPKQRKILAFPYSKYDALICDGAVRSGKTSLMAVAFIDWAMREFSGQRFGLCGKTVDSCSKNLVVPYISLSYAKERYTMRWRRADKVLEVRRGAVTNYFEVFGGKDESSFALIQGRTLAGVLLDEVALMPRSFVEQALTRCSVDGAKLWFSCNPESPQHWFYLEWIKRHKERNALYLHFEMTDNPGLSAKTIERYQTMFTGVFYDRYIRGLGTYLPEQEVAGHPATLNGEGTVHSADRNAYPDNGAIGKTHYKYYGIPFENLVKTAAKIVAGEYVGTGTSGSSNKNSLKFGFKPSMVLITGNGYFGVLTSEVSKYFCAGISGWNSLGKNGLAGSVTFDTNGTVSWYATASVGDYNFRDSPNIQFNAQSVTYSYIAIG